MRTHTIAKIVFSFVGILSLSACATVDVNVDSIAGSDAISKKRYVLLPGNKGADPTQLQYQEYARYIKKILGSDGYTKASNSNDADIAIYMGYGVGSPQTHQESYAIPTYGQTGISSSYTTGTYSSYGNVGNYSGTTTYTPTYGVTGYTTGTSDDTTYRRYLFLDAYDLVSYRKSKKLDEVWKITATSTGYSADLRIVFPYMAVAMKKYIAKDTHGRQTISLFTTDPAVSKLINGDQNNK